VKGLQVHTCSPFLFALTKDLVSHEIIVQFVGFESKLSTREYTFTVREQSLEPRAFTLTISNDAFNDRRLRYQDAPDVCSLKLRRELAAWSNHPPQAQLLVTDLDLEEYRSTHVRAVRSVFSRKPVEDY
jgi:hypothetical protein